MAFSDQMSEVEFLREIELSLLENGRRRTVAMLGLELEGHLHAPGENLPACRVHEVEGELNQAAPYFVHEVHGGRLEVLTDPQPTVRKLVDQLERHLALADGVLADHGMTLTAEPIIELPDDHLKVVYPVPRYTEKIGELGRERGRAALRVASLQFHRGVGSWEEALAVYRAVRSALPELKRLGDLSRGERYRICETWCGAGCYAAPDLRTPHDVWEHSQRYGWTGNPKGFWSQLRINCRHGTIELRTPDSSRNIQHITRMAEAFARASTV
ncbi:MAG: glutamate-cysteine ligase family protein [Candidatus Uhrbacteria bacterium]